MVYIPGRPDSLQCVTLTPWIERLYAAAIRWAGGRGAAGGDSRRGDGRRHRSSTSRDRRILHLLNHNRDSKSTARQLTPLEKVVIDFAVPDGRRVQRIHTPLESGRRAIHSRERSG